MVGAHDWAEETARRNAREADHASRLALAGRVVVSDLATARSDLQMLGAIGVVRDYVENARPEEGRRLWPAISPRSWPRGPGAAA